MRHASAGLQSLLLSSSEFFVCDLLTIVLPSGLGTLYYTSADADITCVSQFDGASHVFSSKGPPFTRGATKLVRGLSVDTLDLIIHGRQGLDTVPASPTAVSWPTAARTGLLDSATICLEKLIAPSASDTSRGTLIQFFGRVGTCKPSRNAVEIEVRSGIDALQVAQFPRNVYQPTCLNTLFDAGCTLSKGAFTVSGTFSAGSTTNTLHTALANASGYFDQGTILFTSGPNAGLTRTVSAFIAGSPAVVILVTTLPVAPTNTDTFSITPGCDKARNTCLNKFSNLANFRGFPFVPVAEAAR